MKLTCAIIDDEPLAVELLESYVRKTPFLELKGAYNGGITALEALKTEPVDLLFCDIQMPELSGMELSRMLPTRTRVVFTTAFDRYAVEGFRVGAVDYLLKPISYADFLTAANKAFEWFELKRRSVGKPSPAGAGPESIFVKTEYRLRQIELDKILYIEGLKDYVKIYVEDEPRPHAVARKPQIAGRTAPRRTFRPGTPLLHRPTLQNPNHRAGPDRLRQNIHPRFRRLQGDFLRISGSPLPNAQKR